MLVPDTDLLISFRPPIPPPSPPTPNSGNSLTTIASSINSTRCVLHLLSPTPSNTLSMTSSLPLSVGPNSTLPNNPLVPAPAPELEPKREAPAELAAASEFDGEGDKDDRETMSLSLCRSSWRIWICSGWVGICGGGAGYPFGKRVCVDRRMRWRRRAGERMCV